MESIKRVMSKIAGVHQYQYPVYDGNIYDHNEESYCGGALQDSNILLVTDCRYSDEIITEWAHRERFYIAHILCDTNTLSLYQIGDVAGEFVGPFTHIINIVNIGKKISKGSNTIKEVSLQWLYHQLQTENQYLMQTKQIGTICSIVICENDDLQSIIEQSAVESMISGLGLIFNKQRTIITGIVIHTVDNLKSALNVSAYLSSKYGYILTGEVLHMKDR